MFKKQPLTLWIPDNSCVWTLGLLLMVLLEKIVECFMRWGQTTRSKFWGMSVEFMAPSTSCTLSDFLSQDMSNNLTPCYHSYKLLPMVCMCSCHKGEYLKSGSKVNPPPRKSFLFRYLVIAMRVVMKTKAPLVFWFAQLPWNSRNLECGKFEIFCVSVVTLKMKDSHFCWART